jgi:hypothetical protein
MPRRPLLSLLLPLALATSACRIDTAVTVAVDEDGSGRVTVAVDLDAEATRRLPDLDEDGTSGVADLAALVRTDDLAAAGWTVDEPVEDDDGGVALAISRPFGTPDEADRILAELTGPDGALRHLDVSRTASFGRTELGFSGTADLSGGLEAFGDDELAAVLDGEPLGEDAAAIEEGAGVPLSEAVTVEITADLAGESTVWAPRLGDAPLAMDAQTTEPDVPVLVLAAVAVAAMVALAAVLVVRAVRSRRGAA